MTYVNTDIINDIVSGLNIYVYLIPQTMMKEEPKYNFRIKASGTS